MAFDGLDDRVGHLLGLIPVRLEPLLELSNFAGALDLDIEFDVLSQPRPREVARADESLGANDF